MCSWQRRNSTELQCIFLSSKSAIHFLFKKICNRIYVRDLNIGEKGCDSHFSKNCAAQCKRMKCPQQGCQIKWKDYALNKKMHTGYHIHFQLHVPRPLKSLSTCATVLLDNWRLLTYIILVLFLQWPKNTAESKDPAISCRFNRRECGSDFSWDVFLSSLSAVKSSVRLLQNEMEITSMTLTFNAIDE